MGVSLVCRSKHAPDPPSDDASNAPMEHLPEDKPKGLNTR